PHHATIFPYTTLFRSHWTEIASAGSPRQSGGPVAAYASSRLRSFSARSGQSGQNSPAVRLMDVIFSAGSPHTGHTGFTTLTAFRDRKSTRLNSSHVSI